MWFVCRANGAVRFMIRITLSNNSLTFPGIQDFSTAVTISLFEKHHQIIIFVYFVHLITIPI